MRVQDISIGTQYFDHERLSPSNHSERNTVPCHGQLHTRLWHIRISAKNNEADFNIHTYGIIPPYFCILLEIFILMKNL